MAGDLVAPSEGGTAYDRIGTGYARQRRADPRLEQPLHAALGPGRLLNVGAGTGSYEPPDRFVVALEPSIVMIRQRAHGSAPVIQGVAEALPFADGSFDVAMAIMTVHHWLDPGAGLRELCRVAQRRVVLTFDPEVHGEFWLLHYLPGFDRLGPAPAPSVAQVMEQTGATSVTVLPVPWDCTDGMAVAYWRRPAAYLDHAVRAGSSGMRHMDEDALRRGLARLRGDLASGRWHDRYGHLLGLDELDCGLRLIVGEAGRGPRGRRAVYLPSTSFFRSLT